MKANKNFTDLSLKRISEKISELENFTNNLVDKLYPIGSIYMSVNDVNPTMIFGGTWERIKDTFLLASGDIYEAGIIGGESEHTLTIDEMPKHSHRILQHNNNGTSGAWVFDCSTTSARNVSYTGGIDWSSNIELTGGSQPHNNMPPYISVFVWKRTT